MAAATPMSRCPLLFSAKELCFDHGNDRGYHGSDAYNPGHDKEQKRVKLYVKSALLAV